MIHMICKMQVTCVHTRTHMHACMHIHVHYTHTHAPSDKQTHMHTCVEVYEVLTRNRHNPYYAKLRCWTEYGTGSNQLDRILHTTQPDPDNWSKVSPPCQCVQAYFFLLLLVSISQWALHSVDHVLSHSLLRLKI